MRVTATCAGILAVAMVWGAAAAQTPRDLEVVVHRGANRLAPENTKAAAAKALKLGADYVEVDVRASKDGVLYILHDATVDRTTDGAGPIAEMSSSEVDALDAGSWFASEFAGEPVPRLERFLQWIRGKGKVYFDVKSGDLRKVIALVRKYDLEDDCFFWFGNPMRAQAFRRMAPDLPLKVNCRTPEDVVRADEALNIQLIETSLERARDPELVKACRDRGIKIMLRDEEDEDYFRGALRSEADLINLDDLSLYNEVRESVRDRPPAP